MFRTSSLERQRLISKISLLEGMVDKIIREVKVITKENELLRKHLSPAMISLVDVNRQLSLRISELESENDELTDICDQVADIVMPYDDETDEREDESSEVKP